MNCISKLRRAVVLSVIFVFFVSFTARSQLRWDGGGNDGLWTTAANWENDILPAISDDVILDNTLVSGSYMVFLPGGMEVITVRTLIIQPSGDNTIELILPPASAAVPAFIATGPGYGLNIHAGGIFRNASGISSGQSLQVSDSIRVNNGGQYIHQTRASHATSIAQVLSRDVGTETGVVEFDVPGTTGYTISASARVYGTLKLSSNAAGTTRTYSSSGASDLTIRGDWILNAGASYNLNLSGDIIVGGNLVHQGQSLNISSGGDNTVLQLKGHLRVSGIVTETSTGFPAIELCGTGLQQVQVDGSIINSISLRMNNASGAVLQSPVSLPWKLELNNGKIITSPANLLTLLPGCTLEADSLSHNSFIDGPLRKEGLIATDHFLFPVGKDIHKRWLALKNASGSFTVAYFKTDPVQISSSYGPGINHISRMEYWSVEADDLISSMAKPELSFADPNSGGVTDLSALRVAQLVNNTWTDAGNTGVSGTAGSNGSVTGFVLTGFGTTSKYFTLAGSTAAANPLPLGIFSFYAQTHNGVNLLRWTYTGNDVEYFELMHSTTSQNFKTLSRMYATTGRSWYSFTHQTQNTHYYQLNTMKKSGEYEAGKMLSVANKAQTDWLLNVNGNDRITVTFSSSKQKTEICTIIGANGRVARQFTAWLSPGINNVMWDISSLPAGMYTLRSSTNSRTFVKR